MSPFNLADLFSPRIWSSCLKNSQPSFAETEKTKSVAIRNVGNATIAKDGNCHHFANHQRPSPTSVVCFPGSLLSCWPRPEKALFEAHFSAHVSVCGVLVTLCEQPWFQVLATFCLDLCRHTLTSGIRACSPTPYRQRALLELHQFANPAVVRTRNACFAS